MPSGPVLKESDKIILRKNLIELCEKSWIEHGYKKTNIKNLCKMANFSIGTFYSLFPTKEQLFLETINAVQKRLTQMLLQINKDNPTSEGFSQSIKILFREYNSKPFLYNTNCSDFQSFLSKLPDDTIGHLKFDSMTFLKEAIAISDLELKISEEEAYGVFSALLSTFYAKDILATTCDYFFIFDFMIDNLIPNIFKPCDI